MVNAKFTRELCNLDIINRLLLNSDPLVSSLRPIPKTKTAPFTKETLDMLIPADPEAGPIHSDDDFEGIEYDNEDENRKNCKDDARPRRPSTSSVDENIERVRSLVLFDRQFTVRMVADDPNLEKLSAHTIPTKHLGRTSNKASWSSENMTAALTAIGERESMRHASSRFEIPRSTLQDRLKSGNTLAA
ncbi:hypothetical protein ILUMI_00769 [Ignelater luminosus]|uniref:HTH psq-type domain-containing protein n=1 Tax=Ignelater luminosus TaxID=2038154 RepID=A0A8K0DFU1_IGNLU|nr:hypothetical protein ILUMI_00769 [Ignelater luminosus]